MSEEPEKEKVVRDANKLLGQLDKLEKKIEQQEQGEEAREALAALAEDSLEAQQPPPKAPEAAGQEKNTPALLHVGTIRQRLDDAALRAQGIHRIAVGLAGERAIVSRGKTPAMLNAALAAIREETRICALVMEFAKEARRESQQEG